MSDQPQDAPESDFQAQAVEAMVPTSSVVRDAVTPASAWKNKTKEGLIVELPSGSTARLRRSMDLMDLLTSGVIPNPLADMVREMIRTRRPMPNLEGAGNEAVGQLWDLVNLQIPHIFIEPRVEVKPIDWAEKNPGVEWEPSEDAIALTDIDPQDKFWAFSFAQGMTLDLARFRGPQAPDVADVQHGEGVASPPVATPVD